MSSDARLLDLLVRYEELAAQGQAVTPEVLCRDCPELLDELRQRLTQLQQADALVARARLPGGIPSTALQDETMALRGEPAALMGWGAFRWRGRFTALRAHARGGLGQVYLARDEDLGREVALKQIRVEFGGSHYARRRFCAEAEITAQLEHPGVVPIHALGEDERGCPYYVMRFVRGCTLAQEIAAFHGGASRPGTETEHRETDGVRRREGEEAVEQTSKSTAAPSPPHPLTPSFSGLAFRGLLRRFIDICQAVAFAHSKGIIHRDLKPSNVMLGEYGETLVLDWGLAKRMGIKEVLPLDLEKPASGDERSATGLSETTCLTRPGEVMGTPAYMAPEQAAGDVQRVGTATDVYALGAILREILSGRPPRADEGLTATIAGASAVPAPRPPRLRGPRALEAICLRALASRPEDRYTALELAREVERWLGDEPVNAYREPVTVRAGRFARKHRTLVTSAAAVLLMALLALTAGLIIVTGLNRQLDQANINLRVEQERTARERDRAQVNFDLAKDAVDKYLSKVTATPKLKEKDFFQLRKELLETAVPFYQKFVQERSDDPELEAARGRAYHRLAFVRAAMGKTEAARADYEAMRGIFAKLAADFPGVPAYRQYLARSHNNQGNLLQDLGKHREAEATCRAALKIQEQLAADFPSVTAYRQELAGSHNNLGVVLVAQGKRAEAEAAHRAALKIQERLAADFPSVTAYRQELAISHYNLGNLLADLRKRREAEAAFRVALNIQEQLAADFPSVPAFRQDLARSHNNLGQLLAELGKRAETEAAHRAALKIREQLAAEFASVPAYRQDLAVSHNNLGALLAALGRNGEAESAYRIALKIFEHLVADSPSVPAYRRGLASSHKNLGNLLADLEKGGEAEAAFRAALKIKEQLAADFPSDPDYLVDLGGNYCNFGNLVREKVEPQAALDWYAKAIGALEPVLQKEPRLATARQFLRNTHWGRARALDMLQRHGEAVRDWDRAVELDDGREKATFQLGRARSLIFGGLNQDHAWPLLWGWRRF